MPESIRPGGWELYEQAPCGLLVTSRDGTLWLANATFCRWLGFEPESLVGQRRFQDLLSMGGRIFHQTHWAPLLQMQGSVAEVKLDLVHREGHSIPMVMNAVVREVDGDVRHEIALFVADDRHTYERELLQARKRAEKLLADGLQARQALELAEAQLRIALESADLFVWGADPETGRREFEPRIALLLGFDSPRPVERELFASLVEPSDRAGVLKAFEGMLRASTDLFRATFRVNGVDGKQRTVLATARAIGEAGGKRRIVGLLQDITWINQQRAAAEDRALFAEQMVGIVSHDLRNPLSTIKLGTQLLERTGPTPQQAKVHGNIARAVTRSLVMVGDLLDFTRARIGQGLPVDVNPLDLHALVAGLVEELALAHPTRALVHERVGEGEAWADADRLGQLIGNLVSNAINYGDCEAPVTVTSRIDAGRASVTVHNSGPVIPPTVLPTLFQPMVRGTEVGAAHRSVGLGLYIVSEIARAHGGDVHVTSAETEGTAFTVNLPGREAIVDRAAR